jgi:cyclophilin family peptidyl-prolyl cis-trans isomerase
MIKRRHVIQAAAAAPLSGVIMSQNADAATDLSNTVYMDIDPGRVTITLRPDLAPQAAERIRVLSNQGFYDGCEFFRVIAGFVAQTGDRSNTGTQGSDLPNLPSEFTDNASFLTGTVGMARTNDPNSANSQFYICLAPATFLDGKYTIVGQVTAGMDAVQKIHLGSGASGSVKDPTKIVKMRVATN